VAGQVDAERPQAHLEAQGTSREHGHDLIFHETVRIPRGFTAGSHDVGGAFTDTPALQGILQVMSATSGSRADLHVHSTASEQSRLGVQRALGLPECATPPEEVYALAKRRGMDFVTITDHDTIDGVLEIAGDTVVLTTGRVSSGKLVEARVVVPAAAMDVAPSGEPRLPTVLAEEARYRAAGVEGVPSFFLDGDLAFSGAVEPPLLAEAIRRARTS